MGGIGGESLQGLIREPEWGLRGFRKLSHPSFGPQPWGLALMQFQVEAIRRGMGPLALGYLHPRTIHGFHMSPHRLSLGEWGTPNVHESQGRGLPPPHSAVHSRERTDSTVNRGWACGTRCCKQPQTEPGVKLLKCLRVGGQVANSFPFPVTRVLGLFRSNCFPHT